MATESDLRALALALPGVEERPSYGKRPSWKVAGRGFLGVWKDGSSAVFLAEDLAEKRALLADEPDKFFTTPHHGDSPRLLVRLSAVGLAQLQEIVTESWRRMAPEELLAAFDSRPHGEP